MTTDPINEYLAVAKNATLQTAAGEAALQAAVHHRWSVKTGADAGAEQLVGQVPTATTVADLRALAVPAILPPDGRSVGAEQTVWQLSATLTGFKHETDGDYHLVIADDQGMTMIAEIPDPSALAPGSFFAAQIAGARQVFDHQFGLRSAAHPVAAHPVAAPSEAARSEAARSETAPSEAAPAEAASLEVKRGEGASEGAAAPEFAVAAVVPALVQANTPVILRGLGFFDFAHGQDGVAPNAIELHPVISIEFGGQAPPAPLAEA